MSCLTESERLVLREINWYCRSHAPGPRPLDLLSLLIFSGPEGSERLESLVLRGFLSRGTCCGRFTLTEEGFDALVQ